MPGCYSTAVLQSTTPTPELLRVLSGGETLGSPPSERPRLRLPFPMPPPEELIASEDFIMKGEDEANVLEKKFDRHSNV